MVVADAEIDVEMEAVACSQLDEFVDLEFINTEIRAPLNGLLLTYFWEPSQQAIAHALANNSVAELDQQKGKLGAEGALDEN